MACYAALLSLFHTLNHIKIHPRPPISLDQEQLHSVTQNLAFFQHFLECRHSSEEDKDLESHIQAAAYAAEDVIETHIVDQIHAESTLNTVDLSQGLERVIQDMDLIKKKVMEMMSKEKMKGSQHHLHTNSPVPTASVAPASTGQSSTMARFDEVLINKVLDKLTGQQCDLQIIPIVGMGGIGKTTLAMNVYTKPLINQHFDIHAWVTISQEYSRRNILQLLCKEAIGINDNVISGMSEDELGEKVYKKLWGRRYLIVMDDMWSIEAYDIVKSFFPDNNGSRIMITTRLSNLAFELSSSQVFRMQFLDTEKSWDLLREIVFGKLACPNELEKIGKEIARNCRGLPLSIVVIGGLLKEHTGTKAHWEYILRNLNSLINLEEDEYCLQLLRTSYNELPIHLKPCFLYMGVYPEDFEIKTSQLIKLWVSEGILKPNDDKSLEEVAKDYLKELIQRNLILVHKLRWNGEAKICKVHDLLRDVCLREAKKQKFLCIVRPQKHHTPQGLDMERRICIHHENAKKKYSLEFLHAVDSALFARSILYAKHDNKNNDSPSLRSRLLRVYSSVDNYYRMDTYSNKDIFECANLRYLSLKLHLHAGPSFFSLCYLLWNLQTLYVVDQFIFKPMAPSEIWEMPLLRHATLPKFVLPDPLNRGDNFVLENLQTLSYITNLKLSEEVVKRIPNVKTLKVQYLINSDTYGEELTNFGLNNLDRLQKLESFYLDVANLNGEDFINLRSSLVSFPHSLKKLSLSGTEFEWEDLNIRIGSLPFLQVLKLDKGACWGTTWETVEGQFCSLRVLHISYCEIVYWDTDSTHFPLLELLLLRFIEELEEIPSCIGDISTLKSIRLKDCCDSAQESARRIKEEQEENGNEDLQIIIG